MKKLYLILLSAFALLNTVLAQKLSVESFVLSPTDITAQTEGRKDLNGDACALVKIPFVGDVIDVEGNVIKPLVKRNNETWAFMTQNSRQMKVVAKDYLPLMVTFGDYGIEKLQSNRTYMLALAKSSGTFETQQMQTLTIKYAPMSAMVLVDNKLVKGSNGVAKASLPIGQHSFVVACTGYESEEGTVKLKPTVPSTLQITLSKEVASATPALAMVSQRVHPQRLDDKKQLDTSSNIVGSSSNNVLIIPVKNGIYIEMVKVEAGCFDMGATPEMEKPHKGELPVHRVTLTDDFYLGKYEVTQELWKAVMGQNPSHFKGKKIPVGQVSWIDCQEFILKLNKLTGKSFRLPTEAEWEFAARGGNKSCGYQYSGSNILDDVAWYKNNSGDAIHAVGTKRPNELGLYDMSGNVWEWCQDYDGAYSCIPQTNPTGADNGIFRISRGGCWNWDNWFCRLSYRSSDLPSSCGFANGLRLALSE